MVLFVAFLIHSLLCGCVTLAYLILRKVVKASPTVRYIFDCILFLLYAVPTMLVPRGKADGEGIVVHDSGDMMSVFLASDSPAGGGLYQGGQVAEFTHSSVEIVFYIWLAIVLVLLVYMCCKNLLYMKQVSRWRRPLEGVGEDCFTERVYLCPILTTPILRGVVCPSLYFPEQMAGERDIRLIGYHEEVHYRRKDVLLKMAVTIIAAVHWFNPFVWLLYECFQKDCELSCDSKAAERMTEEERKEYLQLLIRCAKKQTSMSMVAAFGFNRRFLEERIEVVMSKKKKWIIGTLILAVCVVCGIGAITCYTYQRELTPEETIVKYLEDPEENGYLMLRTWTSPEYIDSIEVISLEKADMVHAQILLPSDVKEGYTKIRVFSVTYDISYNEEYKYFEGESGIKTQFFTLVYLKDGWRINEIGY